MAYIILLIKKGPISLRMEQDIIRIGQGKERENEVALFSLKMYIKIKPKEILKAPKHV